MSAVSSKWAKMLCVCVGMTTVLAGCPRRGEIHREAKRQFELGEAYFRRDDLTEAEGYYEKARAVDPRFADPYDRLALIAKRRGQLRVAAVWMKRALRRDNTNPTFWDHMGLIHRDQKRYKRAIRDFQTALKFDVRHFEARLHLAQTFRRVQAWGSAKEQGFRLLTENPKRAEPHYELGLLYEAQQQWKSSLQSLKRAVERAPRYADAHAAMGRVYLRRKQYRLSLLSLRRAIQINPNHKEARALFGVANRGLRGG